MRKLLLISMMVVAGCNHYSGDKSSVRDEATKTPSASGIIYRNPRVYNVDYSLELAPDPNRIDRAKDLKLWLPVPREWDSQKAVKVISVDPRPHAEYIDPEHGNRMFFWDFGKGPEKSVYAVNLKYRLKSYELRTEIDPNRVGSYDKTSQTYVLYTRSTYHLCITPEVETLAHAAVGDETNPYLQAKRISDFVIKKMRFGNGDRRQKGLGILSLLDTAKIDKKTGEQYYEGICAQYAGFFITLCRASGIPARGITGMVGWGPWMKEKDLKLRNEEHTRLSPGGLAATRLYGALGGHIWAEFYLPNYGWIQVDPTWRLFGRLPNKRVILSKGTDVLIGPNAPEGDSEGYGDQWIPIRNGRTYVIGWGVWNIARIRIGKGKTLHHSDPFPADTFAEYASYLYPEVEAEEKLAHYKSDVLSWIDKETRQEIDKSAALTEAYEQSPRRRYDQEQYYCHMLREVVGDKKFFDIFEAYMNLLINSETSVPTVRFQKIAEKIYGKSLDWFFEQWLEREELPELRLEDVTILKEGKKWHIQGNLRQLSDSVFCLPVELELETEKEKALKTIWMETKKTPFEFSSPSKPKRIMVDPKLNILKIQKMPPRLGELLNVYPELLLVYGTLSEGQANKAAAERFNREYLEKIIKADVDVNEADLKTRCLILVGRPETNKIAQQFKDSFPIKFDGDQFTWQGMRYDKATQGLAQVIEHPQNSEGVMIMCAGLSPEATLKFCDLELYDEDASFVIFDGDKELLRGYWEDVDNNLYWNFDTHPSVRSAPNEQ